MDWTVGGSVSEGTAERGTSRTLSERVKMKDVRRVYVGERRNISWSLGDRIRRVGSTNWSSLIWGGDGRAGVSGAGSEGFSAFTERLRGTRRGISFSSTFLGSTGAAGAAGGDSE